MSRDDDNRRIGEWLGWKYEEWIERTQDGVEKFCRWNKPALCNFDWAYNYLPNFFTDEAANGLILRKLAFSKHALTIVFKDGLFTLEYRSVHLVARPMEELLAGICQAAIGGESL